MISTLQKQTILAIINIFETSLVLGDYGKVTIIPGDTGGLTYGRSQTTINSGNLPLLLGDYVDRPTAIFSDRLKPYLPKVQAKQVSLEKDRYFCNLLRAAADDPAMRETQDDFFDRVYYASATASAKKFGIETALGLAIVFDSTLHGSLDRMRRRTNEVHGTIAAMGEKRWLRSYLAVRRDWLANHTRKDLRATVYRMDELRAIETLGAWDLALPLVVRNQVIDEAALARLPERVYAGPPLGSRAVCLENPVQRGLDVRLVQLSLSHPDVRLESVADGIFGKMTDKNVRAFQRNTGLPESGRLDQADLTRLPV